MSETTHLPRDSCTAVQVCTCTPSSSHTLILLRNGVSTGTSGCLEGAYKVLVQTEGILGVAFRALIPLRLAELAELAEPAEPAEMAEPAEPAEPAGLAEVEGSCMQVLSSKSIPLICSVPNYRDSVPAVTQLRPHGEDSSLTSEE